MFVVILLTVCLMVGIAINIAMSVWVVAEVCFFAMKESYRIVLYYDQRENIAQYHEP